MRSKHFCNIGIPFILGALLDSFTENSHDRIVAEAALVPNP